MNFSQRMGFKEVKSIVQIDSIDHDLKNRIWTTYLKHIGYDLLEHPPEFGSERFDFIGELWHRFFRKSIDQLPSSIGVFGKELREQYFTKWDWNEIYDFVEFVAQNGDCFPGVEDFIDDINAALKLEISGFRLVNNKIAPIMDESQIQAIQDSVNNSRSRGLDEVYEHLQSALDKLSDKRSPDYRNSIKEAVSAVEALSKEITGMKKAKLSNVFRAMTDIDFHPSLKEGFLKLYGYTSDSNGIRHSLDDKDNLDQEDALYMLVICSAFVNYLMVKSDKSGIQF